MIKIRLERITLLNKIIGKGIDIVFVLAPNGKIIRKHIDHLKREDWEVDTYA